MTREIKFRAWDSRNRIMGDGVNVLDDEFDNMVTHFQDAQYVCMQFTGLKDKNGKEIYEGDVIQWWDRHENRDLVAAVEWDSTVGIWHYDVNTFAEPRKVKVIGNIYENSELLK
jgi:uncharacterized phage protein (TIGR01671 family)